MSTEAASAGLLIVWLLSSVLLRVGLHWRSTGSLGVVRLKARIGSVEWFGGVLFLVGLLAAGVGVFVAQVSEWSTRVVVGFVLAAIGVIGTFVSQSAMGTSWRIGVDPTEQTTFRSKGLFAVVRNPIFTSMSFTLVGFTVLSLHWLVLVGTMLFVVSIELQVRFVEEPYLYALHRNEFPHYVSTVGRFIPGIGRNRLPNQ